jgi:hypothetical protein
VAEARHLAELEAAVGALLEWAETCRVPLLLIGGVAVSLLSRPRTTKDVDAVVWLPNHEDWGGFLAASKRHGIVPRASNVLEFALESRVLLLMHAPTGVPIDVSMGALPFEEIAIRRRVQMVVGRLRVPVPTPEDLVVFKAIAHRLKDAADIESILEAHPDVDATQILTTVREFAEILEMPELIDDLLRLLPKRRSLKATEEPRPKSTKKKVASRSKKRAVASKSGSRKR